MKRTAFFLILSGLAWPLAATSALGQDAPADPEAGDTGGTEAAGGAEHDVQTGAGADAETSTAAPDDSVAAPGADGVKPVSVGLLLGYGINLDRDFNPWGIGFGARGGYNLDNIYLGVRFVFYLGESVSAAAFGGGPGDFSVNVWELGVEAGYDLDLGAVTLRPEVGFGLAGSSSDSSAPGVVSAPKSSTDLYLAPGASVLYDVTPVVFVGVDTRLQFVLITGTPTALIFLANGGMHF
jgi:hypothetical protein